MAEKTVSVYCVFPFSENTFCGQVREHLNHKPNADCSHPPRSDCHPFQPEETVLPFDTAQAAWLEWIKDAQPGSPIAEGFEESYRVAFMAGWTARGGTSQSEDSPRHQPTCPLQGQSAHPKIVRGVYCQTCLTFTPSETQQASGRSCADCGVAFLYGMNTVTVESGFVCRKCWSARNAESR